MVGHKISQTPFFHVLFACALSSWVSSAVAEDVAFKKIMSRNDDLCDHVHELIERKADKNKKGLYFDPEFKKKNGFHLLSEQGSYKIGTPSGVVRTIAYGSTNVDIDNDGIKELVVKEWVGISGRTGAQLLIIENSDKEVFDKNIISYIKYRKLSGILLVPGFVYKLDNSLLDEEYRTEFYERNNIITYSDISIVEFNSKKYIILNETYRTENQPLYVVVAEVRHDKFEVNEKFNFGNIEINKRYARRLDYQCYFDGNWEQSDY